MAVILDLSTTVELFRGVSSASKWVKTDLTEILNFYWNSTTGRQGRMLALMCLCQAEMWNSNVENIEKYISITGQNVHIDYIDNLRKH